MSKWRIEVSWEWEGEAEDEGDALCQADMAFSMFREARAEEIVSEEDRDCSEDMS